MEKQVSTITNIVLETLACAAILILVSYIGTEINNVKIRRESIIAAEADIRVYNDILKYDYDKSGNKELKYDEVIKFINSIYQTVPIVVKQGSYTVLDLKVGSESSWNLSNIISNLKKYSDKKFRCNVEYSGSTVRKIVMSVY